MDHLTMWTMAHRAMSHPAWTTLAGGTTAGAGMGHTVVHAAERAGIILGLSVMKHPLPAIVVGGVVFVVLWIAERRHRGGRRRRPVPQAHDHGHNGAPWLGFGVAGGTLVFVIWLIANWQPKAAKHAAAAPHPAPTPTVTHTTIVQHITHVTKAAGIPDGLWWVAGITVVAVLVYYLARGRNR